MENLSEKQYKEIITKTSGKLIKRGNMDKFKNTLRNLRLNSYKIITEQYPSFAKIYWGKMVWFYSDTIDEKDNEFVNLCQNVSKNASSFLKKNPEFFVNKYKAITISNEKAITDRIGKVVSSFDMIACYWNIAYKKGYISENTWIQGIDNKDERLIALGYLNKRYVFTFYDTVFPVKKQYRKEVAMIWHSILKEAGLIYEKLRTIISDEHLYYYNTDGFYCHPKFDSKIYSFFNDNNIAYTTKKYIMESIDDNRFYMEEIGSDIKKSVLIINNI